MRILRILFALTALLQAGQGGYIAGKVLDHYGAAIARADVRVQNQTTGARVKTSSDSEGAFSTAELEPGHYKVTVRKDGFRTVSVADVGVTAGAATRADFRIELLRLRQEITVTAAESRDNPSVSGLTVSRGSTGESLPANGRDVSALFSLMPGATVAPASITAGGQFTVDGQRPNTNSFRVDGVSGNLASGVTSLPGSFPGGSLPAMTTIGSTTSLAAKEEIERVDLKAADFSAQYGERPGAQIEIETQSGSSEFHGSLLGYIRPHALDSMDWFARGAGLKLPSASLSGWGASFGGPLWRNHTYFFASWEHADVHDSALQLISVASPDVLRALPEAYRLLFAAFPRYGPHLTADESLAYSSFRKDASMTGASIRFDQVIGKNKLLFVRYARVPSWATTLELGTAYASFAWESVTFGANIAGTRTTQQFRFNYSLSAAGAVHGPLDAPALTTMNNYLSQFAYSQYLQQDTSGYVSCCAVPQGLNFLLGTQIVQLAIGGVGRVVSGQQGDNSERQFFGNYVAQINRRGQTIQVGGGYTRLSTGVDTSNFVLSITAPSISSLLSGAPLGLTSATFSPPYSAAQRFSAFVQDSFHPSDRLDVMLGARWEYTPPPFGGVYNRFPLVGYWGGIGADPVQVASSSLSTLGYSWKRRFNQFAPRAGLAYRLPRYQIVLRLGAGLFYDTQTSSIVANENPLDTWQYVTPSNPQPSPGPGQSPINVPSLYLPRVWEWRAALEKSVAENGVFSLSYLGSSGRRLLQNHATIDPVSSVLQNLAFTSEGKSSYQALLAQFRTNLGKSMFARAAYTWSHSIDTGSSDTEPLLVQPGVTGLDNKGSSSFDIRHLFSGSFGYRSRQRNLLFKNWTVATTALVRTGFPFDVTTIDRSVGFGFGNTGRASLVSGEPLWISDSSVPGGRRLNAAAFQTPANGENGNLGRNSISGAGLFQVDASIRRQFVLFRGMSLETSLSAFNLLNRASFANPVSYLGSALFGRAASTANLMLGAGSPTTGLTPLYQAGGPRTIELGLRFSF